MQHIPDLDLTYGQMLWAIGHGREPDQLLKDQTRYLRSQGVPTRVTKGEGGSGKRISYGFFDLVELGVAVTGLNLRFRPKDIIATLRDDPESFKAHVRAAWHDLPEGALDAPELLNRQRRPVMMEEDIYLRLHDRRSEKWGKLDFIMPGEEGAELPPFTPVERFEDGSTRAMLGLKIYTLPWVAWALRAPKMRRGRG